MYSSPASLYFGISNSEFRASKWTFSRWDILVTLANVRKIIDNYDDDDNKNNNNNDFKGLSFCFYTICVWNKISCFWIYHHGKPTDVAGLESTVSDTESNALWDE